MRWQRHLGGERMRRWGAVAAALAGALWWSGCSDVTDTHESVAPVTQQAVVCAAGETLYGIDVSLYQGEVDWPAVAGDNIAFAIARTNHGSFLDPNFATNWQAIKDNGLVRGAYQYFEPAGDEVAQAQVFIDHVGTLLPGDLPGVLDIEETGGVSPATIVAKVASWLDLVEAGTGRRPIIYTGQYFWNDKVDSDAFNNELLWIAQYGPACPNLPPAWADWTMWQYSGSGSVAGIDGAVDRNLFNGNLLTLNDLAANGYRAAVVAVDYPANMLVDNLVEVRLTLQNVGARAWDENTFLDTTQPRDHDSQWAAPSWVNDQRVVSLGNVASGDSVEVTFEVRAPAVAGLYSEHFNLLQEGVGWFSELPAGGGPADDAIALEVVVGSGEEAAGVGPTGVGSGASGGGGMADRGDDGACSVAAARSGRACGGRGAGWCGLLLLGLGLTRRRR